MSIFVWLSTDHIVVTLATIPVFTSPTRWVLPAWLQLCVCYGCQDWHFVFDCKCVFIVAVRIDTLFLIASVCSFQLSGLTLCVWLQVCVRYSCLDWHFVFDCKCVFVMAVLIYTLCLICNCVYITAVRIDTLCLIASECVLWIFMNVLSYSLYFHTNLFPPPHTSSRPHSFMFLG